MLRHFRTLALRQRRSVALHMLNNYVILYKLPRTKNYTRQLAQELKEDALAGLKNHFLLGAFNHFVGIILFDGIDFDAALLHEAAYCAFAFE